MPDLINSPLTLADWLIILGYFVVIILIGALAGRGPNDENNYFLGGRRMPAWAVAMSFAATATSAATFIGAPQDAFVGDLTLLILNLGQVLGVLIVALLFLPRLYRAGTVTIYGYLGQRFGGGSATAAGVVFLLGRLLASGSRLFIAGTAFSLVLYGDLEPRNLLFAILVFGTVGTLYTALGGIKAVIWTDTLQLVIVIGAAVLSIVLLLREIPAPVDEITRVLRDGGDKLRVLDTSADLSRPYTLWAALAMTFFFAAAFGTDQDLAQRLLTCKSLKQSIGSLLGAIAMAVPIQLLFLAIGLLLFIYYRQPEVMGAAAPADALDDARKVYPQYLLNHLPAGVRGLALAGVFAAAMSSLDSAINAMASSAVADLIDPLSRRGVNGEAPRAGSSAGTSRAIVVLMGVLLTAAAAGMVALYDDKHDTLIPFALGVMTFAYTGLLGVFITALFTKRGSTAGVVLALAVGANVIVASRYIPGIKDLNIAFPYWMVLGTLASFLVCVVFPSPRQGGAA